MNEPNKEMNLAVLTAERFLMNGHQIEVLQNQQHPRNHCQLLPVQCSALELTNSWREFPIQYRLRWSSVSAAPCHWFDHHQWGLDINHLSGKSSLSDSSVDVYSWQNRIRWKKQFFHREHPTMTSAATICSTSTLCRLIANIPSRPSIRKSQWQEPMMAQDPVWTDYDTTDLVRFGHDVSSFSFRSANV
jgi:hypothetical protein